MPSPGLLICSTPRSGTHLLAGLIESVGIGGRPREYLFNAELRGNDAAIAVGPAQRTRPEPFRAALQAATTPNGAYGLIVMWSYLEEVVDGLRLQQGSRAANWRDVLEQSFTDVAYVWNRRRDTAAQAVSLYRAMETDIWYAEHVEHVGVDVPYRYDLIAAWEEMIHQHNRSWERFFRASGIAPLCVWYEDVLQAPGEAVAAVLRHMGVPCSDEALSQIRPQTVRQGNDVNERFLDRYRGDRGHPAIAGDGRRTRRWPSWRRRPAPGPE